MAKTSRRKALKIAAIYLGISALWILVSDQALMLIFAQPEQVLYFQTIKGLGFVLLSALLIYLLVQRELVKQHQYQLTIQQSQENYRRMVNTAQEGIWLADVYGNITFVNRALCDMLGYSAQEMIKRPLADFLRTPTKYAVQWTLPGIKKHQQLDLCFRHKDNSSVWMLVSITPLLEADRELRGIMGMGVNITERKRAEETLQESEKRFRYLFENCPIALQEVDYSEVKSFLNSLGWQQQGDLATYLDQHPEVIDEAIDCIKIVDVNRDTLALYCTHSKDDYTRNFRRLLGWDSREMIKGKLIAIASGLTEYEKQGVNYTLNGDKIDVLLRWTAVPGFEQSFSKVIISVVDVTAACQAEQMLKLTESRYRMLVEQVTAVIYTNRVDETNSSIYVSPQIEDLTGHSAQDWMENLNMWQILIHPEDGDRVLHERARTNQTGGPFEMEYRLLRKDGRWIWVHDQAVLRWDEQTQTLVWQGVMIDITERKCAEDALRQSESRFRLLLQSQGEGTVLFDLDGKYLYVNPAAENLFGVEPDTLVGHKLSDFISPQGTAELIERVRVLLHGASSTHEVVALQKNLIERYLLVTLSPWYESDGTLAGGLAVCRDITQRKRDEGKMRFQSTHDSLTGVFNRHHFDECFERIAREALFPVSLVMADVDGMKLINDTFGHMAGDNQLKRTAQILKETFRSQDIVARIGGDEFAVLLPGISQDACEEVVKRLNLRLREINQANPSEPLKLSIGAATAVDQEILATVFQRADEAMYVDKARKHINLSVESNAEGSSPITPAA